MAIVSESGFANPFDADGQLYSSFGQRTPMLRSFYLGYSVGSGSPIDRHNQLIQILPGGTSEDLSPNADLNPSDIPSGRLQVSLQDKNPAGETFFFQTSHSIADLPGARRFQYRDVGGTGEIVQKLPLPQNSPAVLSRITIALVGFKLFFTGGRDHHLDRVGVWFRDDELHVAMRDKNGDDVFGYLVDFVVIPTHSLNVSTGIRRGSARGGERINIPRQNGANFALTGWAFNYVSGDHHIRDLGIVRHGDDVSLFYGDKSADDLFDWRLEWSHIGHQEIAPF